MSVKPRVTITDIAQRSGASRTTVSLVLRDRPGIGSETRDRVLAVANELGYVQRSSSRRHPAGLTTVAVLFRARSRSPEHRSMGVNPFYSWVLTGMESVARTRQMNLIFGTLAVNERNEIVDAPDYLLAQDLDGMVIVGAFVQETVHALIDARTCPVVVTDGPAAPQRYDVVASDNVGGARAAVRHLIEAGHERIALVAPEPVTVPNFWQREQGYLEEMRKAGLAPLVARFSGDRAQDSLRETLARDPAVTALFVVNDAFAIRVMKAAVEAGYDVPASLSIVGFDDTDHAVTSVPELTTMRVDKVGMGRHAVLQLATRLMWPDAAPVLCVLSPELVSRGSVAAPNAMNDRRPPARQGG